MLSIVIPAYNEQKNLERLIPYLVQHGGTHVQQIIVAQSPRSNDDLSFLSKYKEVIIVLCSKGRRSIQLNEGAEKASSPWIYFLHADSIPPPEFASEIITAIQQGYTCGCFSYRFDSPSRWLAINAYFTRKKGPFTGGGDQGLFISRSLFQQMKGYKNSLQLMEDFDLYHRLKETNEKFVIIPNDAIVSARKYDKNNYLKVNLIQLLVFLAYQLNLPQESWINLYKKLKA